MRGWSHKKIIMNLLSRFARRDSRPPPTEVGREKNLSLLSETLTDLSIRNLFAFNNIIFIFVGSCSAPERRTKKKRICIRFNFNCFRTGVFLFHLLQPHSEEWLKQRNCAGFSSFFLSFGSDSKPFWAGLQMGGEIHRRSLWLNYFWH